ncbi:MAG: LuxR C-terminal-related transcriptional regulator [Aeromicrobium sp.]
MTAGEVAAVVAVEAPAELVDRVTDQLQAVASDHGGSSTDRVATFAAVTDGLLAVAALLKNVSQVQCGVVILDGGDVPAAVSVAREVARGAGVGQIVVSALRRGTGTRLGVLHGNLESLVIARAMAQGSAKAIDDEPSSAELDLRTKLSPAEYRVAEAVGQGATNKEVAGRLFISVKTVDYHLQNIYRKLGARSRTELAVRVAGSSRGGAAPGLTEDQLRFIRALEDQPGIARWGSGVHGIGTPDETGD